MRLRLTYWKTEPTSASSKNYSAKFADATDRKAARQLHKQAARHRLPRSASQIGFQRSGLHNPPIFDGPKGSLRAAVPPKL
jgi:hypothetical protein